MAVTLTAEGFTKQVMAKQSAAEQAKITRYFKNETAGHDAFAGIKMGDLFQLAKLHAGMPVAELEKLLESPVHELRAGAISIMDKESRGKKIPAARLEDMFNLYMRRHDRVNNWDLVDLGCLHLTGLYLFNKPRTILYKLAKSKNTWQRRTAIVSTCYFIRQGQLDDTYALAEILLHDKEDLVNKATGWMLRFAGDKDKNRLVKLLDAHAATMPRILLRNCIEKFSKAEREHYLGLKA